MFNEKAEIIFFILLAILIGIMIGYLLAKSSKNQEEEIDSDMHIDATTGIVFDDSLFKRRC
jgi:uncharacterized membrane-anchored protein YhcB (DUF1043 family)